MAMSLRIYIRVNLTETSTRKLFPVMKMKYRSYYHFIFTVITQRGVFIEQSTLISQIVYSSRTVYK